MRSAPPPIPALEDPRLSPALASNYAWWYYYSRESKFARRAVRHLRHHRIEWAVHVLRPHIADLPRSLLLEVGCGPGEAAVQLDRAFGPFDRVAGLDLSQTLAPLFRAIAATNRGSARYLRASCLELPVGGSSTSLIASFEMIEHVPGWNGFFREAARALIPGGILLVTTPNAEGFHARAKRLYQTVRGFERLNRAYRKAGDFYERFIPAAALRTALRESGLEPLAVAHACHTLSFLPEPLSRLNRQVERTLERRALLERAAVTTFVVARKPK